MKNVWKGLAIGALVGALVGVILDTLGGGSGQLKDVSRKFKAQAPAAAGWLSATAEKGAGILSDAQVPDRVRDTVHRVGESGVADQVKDAASQAASQVKVAANQARGSASDAVAKGKAAVADASR